MNAPRFITLTRKHDDKPLREQLDEIARWFKTLRRSKVWKQHVKGGVYAVECKRNARTGRWHPHLHIIADGEYFPHKLLAKEWENVTGESSVVDIRPVLDRSKIAAYIAAYITKGDDVTTWSAAAVQQYADAVHGRRMVHTFGSMHGRKVDDEQCEEADEPRETVISLARVQAAVNAGDFEAAGVMSMLVTLGPRFAQACGYEPPSTALCSGELNDESTAWLFAVCERIERDGPRADSDYHPTPVSPT